MAAYVRGMLSVDNVADGDRVTVKVAGDIDLASADKLTEALEKAVAVASEVCVDLSQVTFLDSTGIRSLVQAYRSAQSQGGILYVDGARQWVAKVLDVTGVGPLLARPKS